MWPMVGTWSKVGVDDDALLERCAAVFTQASPSVLTTSAAILRSGINEGLIELYYFLNPQYDVVLEFLYSRRRGRFLVCTAFLGQVQPADVMQRVVQKGQEFVQEFGQPDVYAIRPTGLRPSPLTELYDLIKVNPQLHVETVGRTSDSEIWRIESASP